MKRTVVRVLVALLLVECALQAVDWLRWRRQLVALDSPPIEGRALCVGDDYLFDVGVRSREDSWPVRAGRELADLRNFARPGMDCAELVEQLPEWLDAERPEVVFIGIGNADYRRRTAAPVDPARTGARTGPYRFAFQLGRLAARIGSTWFVTESPDPRALVGAWHYGAVAFTFRPDGILDMAGRLSTWRIDGGQVFVSGPGAEDLLLRWRLVAGRLELESPLQITLEKGPPERGPAERARSAMARGDWLEARWILEVDLHGPDPGYSSLAAAIDLAVAEGRDTEAREILGRLRGAAPEDDDAAARAALVDALSAIGEIDESVELASSELSACLAEPELIRRVSRRVSGTAHARDLFLALAGVAGDAATPAPVRATAAFAAADVIEIADAADALDAAVSGVLLLGADAEPDPIGWPGVLRRASEAELTTALASHPEGDRVIVRRAVERLADADRSTAATLTHNLRLAVATVQFYGARPVILDQPGEPSASLVRREVAEAAGATLLVGDREAMARAIREDLRSPAAAR